MAVYTLPINRNSTWNGNAGVKNGIPTRLTVYTTISPSTDTTGASDYAAITNALANCPAYQVVKLAAGTFYVNARIKVPSNKTLRGNGIGSTILRAGSAATDLYFIVGFDNGMWQDANGINVVSGYTKGSTQIVTASATGWSVGDIFLLDEIGDANGDPPVTNTGSNGTATWNARDGNRYNGQINTITAISGTTITLDVPLHWNFSTARVPQVIKLNSPTIYAGIEDMTVSNVDDKVKHETGDPAVIGFLGTSNCWLLNVEGKHSYACVVRMRRNFRTTIRGCSFHEQVGASNGYGVWVGPAASCLLENSLIYHVSPALTMAYCVMGNVYSYNWIHHLVGGASGWAANGVSVHGGHCAYNLFEGNIMEARFSGDNVWGSGSHNVLLRNRIYLDSRRFQTGNCGAFDIELQFNSRYYSTIGNIIGQGSENAVLYNGVDIPEGGRSIYRTGYVYDSDNGASGNSANVFDTLLRHGDWNCVQNAVIWNGTDSHELPASLYLSAKPSWMGSALNWPPIGPEISPMNPIPPTDGDDTVFPFTASTGGGSALNYYVATTGNDSNPGTLASPFATLSKACSVATSGYTINVAAGTYTDYAQCNLALGVNVRGAGKSSTFINCRVGGSYYFNCRSYGSGGHNISNITFMGGTSASSRSCAAVGSFWKRDNVIIHDCDFKYFSGSGTGFCLEFLGALSWSGEVSDTSPPTTWQTGCQLYNCNFTACDYASQYTAAFRGSCLKDMIVRDCIFDERGTGGYAMKLSNPGWLNNCKFYNCTVYVDGWDGRDEKLNIELWNLVNNTEMYSCTFNNGYISLVKGQLMGGTRAFYFHHNTLINMIANEFAVPEMTVYKNKIYGYGTTTNYDNCFGLRVWSPYPPVTYFSNMIFCYNTFYDGHTGSPCIGFTNNNGSVTIATALIFNNTFNNSGPAFSNSVSSLQNLKFDNNIVTYCTGGCNNSGGLAGVEIQNNCFYNNSSNWNLGSASGQSIANNLLSTNPLYVDTSIKDFKLQVNSPCINVGKDMGRGYPFTGTTYDIGANEYGLVDVPPDEPPPPPEDPEEPGDEATGIAYYVDFVSGSDTNVGKTTDAPFQHCPGDAAATGIAASTTLTPGDSVTFKKGVTYRPDLITMATEGATVCSGTTGTLTSTGVLSDTSGTFVSSAVRTSDYVYIWHSLDSSINTYVESVGLHQISSISSNGQLTLRNYVGIGHAVATISYTICRPITFKSIPSWGTGYATITGDVNGSGTVEAGDKLKLIELNGKNHIKFEDLRFNLCNTDTNVTTAAIANTVGDALYLQLIGNTFENIKSSSVYTGRSMYTICIGNTCTNIGFNALPPGGEGCLYEYNIITGPGCRSGMYGLRYSITRYNYVKDLTTPWNTNVPYGVGPIDAGSLNNGWWGWVHGNIIDNCTYGISLQNNSNKPASNWVVHSNVLIGRLEQTGIGTAAIHLQAPQNIGIYNNTIYGSAGKGWIDGLKLEAAGAYNCSGTDVKNNIFFHMIGVSSPIRQTVNVATGQGTGFVSDYNHFYTDNPSPLTYLGASQTLAAWKALAFDTHGIHSLLDINANPNFISTNLSSLNLGLQTTSPDIAKGTSCATSFTKDVTATARAIWDVGAYMFGAASPDPVGVGQNRLRWSVDDCTAYMWTTSSGVKSLMTAGNEEILDGDQYSGNTVDFTGKGLMIHLPGTVAINTMKLKFNQSSTSIKIEVSTDSTDGLDGTWSTVINNGTYLTPNYTTFSMNDALATWIRLSNTNGGSIYCAHVFGTYTSPKIEVWRADKAAEYTSEYPLAFPNIPDSANFSNYVDFKIYNKDGSAHSYTVTVGAVKYNGDAVITNYFKLSLDNGVTKATSVTARSEANVAIPVPSNGYSQTIRLYADILKQNNPADGYHFFTLVITEV